MPVEVLPELAAYRELVVSVAKELYRAKNAGKKRLPKGFAQRLRLELREVLPGSAMPVLERAVSTPLQVRDEFDDARDFVGRAVEEVAAGRALPLGFPIKSLAAFSELGRTLRPDEHVFLVPPGQDSGPKFDRGVRGSLLLAGSNTYRDGVDIVGELDAVEFARDAYWIRMEDGQRLAVPESLDGEAIALAAGALPVLLPIVVRGRGVFDRNKKLTKLEDVEESVLLEPSPALTLFNASLTQLGELTDDWWGPAGGAFPDAQLRRLRWAFYRLALDYSIPLPVLFPVEPGLVRAEWRPRPQDVSMEIQLSEGLAYIHALNLDTGEAFERDGVHFKNYDEVATELARLLPQEA